MDSYYKPSSYADLKRWLRQYYWHFSPKSKRQAWSIYYRIVREHEEKLGSRVG